VIPGSLSKPPPSASRPPHRASASIRDKNTYTKTLDGDAARRPALKPSPLALNATTKALCIVGMPLVLGALSGHTSGHTRCVFSLGLSENGRKTTQGDGFVDRRLKIGRSRLITQRQLPTLGTLVERHREFGPDGACDASFRFRSRSHLKPDTLDNRPPIAVRV
jgi:hypothetical protein